MASVFRVLEEGMRVFSYFVEPEGVALNPGKLGASWAKVATFGRSVSLDRNEKAQHIFYNQILVALHVVNIDISFNVLCYNGEKSEIWFGCTFKKSKNILGTS